jgi:hypothetical protein
VLQRSLALKACQDTTFSLLHENKIKHYKHSRKVDTSSLSEFIGTKKVPSHYPDEQK